MTKEIRKKLFHLFLEYGTQRFFKGVAPLGSKEELKAHNKACKTEKEFIEILYTLETED